MRSPFYFIVRPVNGRRYDNIKTLGDVEMITSVSQEDHMSSNRFAEVISTPSGYDGPISEGDTLLVHHNVFKIYYDMKGRERSGFSFLKDDTFFVDDEQFFLYLHDGEWMAHSKYCFIKPSKMREEYLATSLTEQPLLGTIRYINQELLDLGLRVGDEITFEPESEYEFTVEGEKLYRMFTNNIAIQWTQTT